MFPLTKYRRSCVLSACAFIAIAFASKAYRGPAWRYSDAYVGDVMVVGFIYFVLSFFMISMSIRRKIIYVFGYALLVELFQATGIPNSWHLPAPFIYVFGSVFNFIDILAYLVGLALAGFLDRKIK
jgi:hypothetical protein